MFILKKNYKIIIFSIISSILCFVCILLYLYYFQIYNVYGSGEVSVVFNDVEHLQNESEVIVEVEVIETQSFFVNESPFTLSKAKINHVYKGSPEDTIINILENGGLLERRNYIFENNPVFNVGEQAIVYLHKYRGPAAEDAYFIRGAYQGKFKLLDDSTLFSNNVIADSQLKNNVLVPPNEVSDGLSNVKSVEDLKLIK